MRAAGRSSRRRRCAAPPRRSRPPARTSASTRTAARRRAAALAARGGSTFTEDLMDKIFLDVLSRSPKKAPDIFLTVLESLTGDEFAEFMAGYCPVSTKAKIIASLPKALFVIAAIRGTFS